MDLRRVDLNLLVALDALLRERNVTRAARRLAVGQSAMSSSLARLRRLFDDRILVRQGRELVMTPLAEALAEPLAEALGILSSLLEYRESFDPATSNHRFVIAASEYVTLTFLHPLIERLRAEAPGVRLAITAENAEMAGRLVHGDIDLLIHPLEVFADDGRFEQEVLFADRYLCAVAASNEAVGDHLSIDDFLRLPYLATEHGGMPSNAERQLDAMGIPVVRELTVSAPLAPQLLRGTPYVSLILARLGRFAQHSTAIRLIEPPMELEPITEAMRWTARNTPDPAHAWLRERLHRLAKEIG